MDQDQLIEAPGVTAPQAGIASVMLDVPLANVDRPFDYAVPADLDETAVVGARVRARFAGRLVDGFVVGRPTSSSFSGQLARLDKVVSGEPVITPAQVQLIRATADHYAGTFADVMRMAVPPRHAATERADQATWPVPDPTGAPPSGGLSDTTTGARFLAALERGEAVRGFWQVPTVHHPAGDIARGVAQAVAAALRAGRGALVLVPDLKDIARVQPALEAALGARTVAVLQSESGPAARYRNYLSVVRGQARVVLGTRSAMFAPVRDLGLVVVLDDGDDLHAEPRTPYPHTRQVAAMRVPIDGCALLLASRARSCEAQAWVEAGWMHPLELPRGELRRMLPLVKVAADSDRAIARDPLAAQVRLPQVVFETIRVGLTQGPVLVQVPRGGHLLALRCERCREPARCQYCHGPLQTRREPGAAEQQVSCQWCARPVGQWRCLVCGGDHLRAPLVGASQTAADFARAFPGAAVVDSSRDHVVDEVGDKPVLVVATPGAEPRASSGYAAAVLLDAPQLLARPDLRAGEEALRRWQVVAGQVRPGAEGGTVCMVGPIDDLAVQAFVRQDPAAYAARLLGERLEAGFPPAVSFVTLEGTAQAVDELIVWAALAELESVELLGPVPIEGPGVGGEVDGLVRMIVRAPRAQGRQVVGAIAAGLDQRAARKATPVRVRVDPQQLG
ncbi:primosomal protein N' [Aestuariimicrobium sp. T2.26MG-19.2B]|uniref:primosomal protein N' n=1 Tax=Aestuariimicrobium sp. T2.26MG-19.2B TaxID=3040679 RepID=UPI002477489B|nr:primosomal protein N' [Aestuariimicrobium sp. T2.26MG-19.2B]CAI9409891.1 putative primosomal protein N' [Aestuariimicrobium sp. T2.26MG-19.2B]